MGIGLLEIAFVYLNTFRYGARDWTSATTTDSYFKPYDTAVGGTNYWSLANMLNGYSKLAIYTVAFVTQILATVGIVPEINEMVWQYGVFYGMPTINVMVVTLMFLA